jgi:hypothetical protein
MPEMFTTAVEGIDVDGNNYTTKLYSITSFSKPTCTSNMVIRPIENQWSFQPLNEILTEFSVYWGAVAPLPRYGSICENLLWKCLTTWCIRLERIKVDMNCTSSKVTKYVKMRIGKYEKAMLQVVGHQP